MSKGQHWHCNKHPLPSASLQGASSVGASAAAAFSGDADDASEWVSALLESALEQVDDAVADARRELRQPAAPRPPASSTAVTLPGAVAAAAAGSGQQQHGSGGFVSFLDSPLQHRPQEAFEDAVDNSRAPFRMRMDALEGVVDVEAEAAADEAALPPHPLAQRLAALEYPAWQLKATGPPQPPRSFEDTPFTYIDTVPALRAAGTALCYAVVSRFAVCSGLHVLNIFAPVAVLCAVCAALQWSAWLQPRRWPSTSRRTATARSRWGGGGPGMDGTA